MDILSPEWWDWAWTRFGPVGAIVMLGVGVWLKYRDGSIVILREEQKTGEKGKSGKSINNGYTAQIALCAERFQRIEARLDKGEKVFEDHNETMHRIDTNVQVTMTEMKNLKERFDRAFPGK